MAAAIAFIFLLSSGITLALTPLVQRTAIRCGWVDSPSDRKVHTAAIPRLGGIGIYLGVVGSLLFFRMLSHAAGGRVYDEPLLIWIGIGSLAVFLMGLWDDFSRLNPFLKLAVQAAAAGLAYFGGVRIVEMAMPWGTVYSLGVASLPVTIFWFVLVINAINLIDGLDGLAAGVSLFAGLSLLVVCLMDGNPAVAFGLAALAGACLGFLRYNFNPASIFMGDGGSYFLGYTLASLSILGTMKSQAAVAILIPIIALGVPLMDTLLAPVRRFVIGKGLFQPDRSHIHHRLLKLGLSQRKAVLVMYGAAVCTGIVALFSVHAADQHAGLFFLCLAVLLVIVVRRLGYLEYLAVDKVLGYFRDVTDEIGIQRDRRTFLGHQKSITEAETMADVWQCTADALASLDLDSAEILLLGNTINIEPSARYSWFKSESARQLSDEDKNILSLSLPLVNHKYHGTLYIKKDMARSSLSQHTLRRIEQLRRTMVYRLTRFQTEADCSSARGAEKHPVCEQPQQR